jgi:ATP-dependent Clp protease ATP-binding subunit ClpC
MTSNIAADKHIKKIGFGNQDTMDSMTTALHEVKKYFRTEFVNRINEIVAFQSLNEEHVKQILRPMVDEICDNVRKKHNVMLRVGEEVEQFVAQTGYSPEYGARELRRAVERLIQIPLSNLILSGDFEKCTSWQVVCGSGGLSIIPL